MKSMIGIGSDRLAQLIVCFTLLFSLNTFSKQIVQDNKSSMSSVMQESQKHALSDTKKGLLIFLDDSEKNEIGAAGGNLLTALYQQASPIIASTSLLYTLFEYRSQDARSINVLYEEIQDFKRKNKKQSLVDWKEEVLITRLGFQPEQWIIKKVNSLLSLLIPVNYLHSLKISPDKVKEYVSGGKPTLIELQLGLRVNHCETNNYESMQRPLH